MSRCIVCDILTSHRCGRCHKVHYCSTAHQKDDYKDHRIDCARATTLEEMILAKASRMAFKITTDPLPTNQHVEPGCDICSTEYITRLDTNYKHGGHALLEADKTWTVVCQWCWDTVCSRPIGMNFLSSPLVASGVSLKIGRPELCLKNLVLDPRVLFKDNLRLLIQGGIRTVLNCVIDLKTQECKGWEVAENAPPTSIPHICLVCQRITPTTLAFDPNLSCPCNAFHYCSYQCRLKYLPVHLPFCQPVNKLDI